MDGFQTLIVVEVILLYPILITGLPKPPENIQISVTRYNTIISWKIVQSNIDWVRLFIKDAENNKHRLRPGYDYVDIKPPNTSYEVSTLAPCNSYTAELYSIATAEYSDTVNKTFWLAAQNVTGDFKTNVTLSWKTEYSVFFNVITPRNKTIFGVHPGNAVINNDYTSKYVYDNTSVIVRDIKITVINVDEADSGIYKSVTHYGSVSSIDECCLLIVSGKPTKAELEQRYRPLFVGDDIHLTCKSDVRRWPAGVSSSLTFHFFGHNGHERIQQHGGTLTINKATKSDIGVNISCQAVDDLGRESEQSDNITLNIFYGPEDLMVSKADKNFTQTLGSRVGPIQCSAICNPKCDIIWKKMKANVHDIMPTNGTLFINSVRKEDDGIYQCIATNPKNRSKSLHKNVSLTVHYPPSIIGRIITVNDITCHTQKISSPYRFSEGDTVQATLTIDSNPAVNLISISYRLQSTHLNFNQSGTMYTFLLPPLHCEDSGAFLIKAGNGIKEFANWTTHFDIRCKPKKVKLFNEKIGTKLDADEIITMSFVSNPTPSVEWYPGSHNLGTWIVQDKDTFYYNATSTVKIRNEFDMRNYTIRIKNEQGTILRNVTFIPRGKPEQPTNFSYENVTFRQATLLWTAGFDGGGPQTFNIFYKKDNDDIFKGPVEVVATDTRKGTKIHHILRGLLSLTSYDVVLVATNEYGAINISLHFTTEAEPGLTSPLFTQRPIFIGAVAGVALLVLALFICFIAKMKKGGNDTRSTNVRTDKNTKKKSKEELADNDIIPGQSNTEYACVNKSASKGLQRKDDSGNSNAEYACVNKSTSKQPQKEDTQENTEYAVVDKTHKNTVFDGENQYANRLDDSSPIINLESKSPGRRVNDDGLVYIEVAFPKNKSDRKPIIIHGDENRTNYVDIDFTKKAEPLSESGND